MIIWTDILIMAIFHTKASRDYAKLLESQTFIQMSGMDIRCDNSVKL